MKNSSLIIGSWMALLAAIVSWCGAGVFAWQVMQMQSERATYASDVAAANLEQGQAAQLHARARDTLAERAALSAAANVDVLAAVNIIESVTSSTVQVRVTGAQTEKVAPTKNGITPVNVVSLVAHAEGPYPALMHILQMLETLPLATTVQSIEFNRPPVDAAAKNPGAMWMLNIRLRFLTTSSLSA